MTMMMMMMMMKVMLKMMLKVSLIKEMVSVGRSGAKNQTFWGLTVTPPNYVCGWNYL